MFLDSLVLKNLLSFKDSTVELGQLNVLIGPNAVGKTNLIEAISLLQAAATSLPKEILRGGGVRQWLWLGENVPSPIAFLECRVNLITGRQTGPLSYSLSFSEEANGFVIVDESLTSKPPGGDPEKPDIYFHRAFNQAEFGQKALELMRTQARPMPVTPSDSVLSQFKNPLDPTPITNLGWHFERMRIFREFRTGISSQARQGVGTSSPRDALSEGGDNLALVLNELNFHQVDERLRYYINRFSDRFDDVKVRVGAGLAQVYLRETGLTEALSAVRMSDGTLRFLCLLAALLHPAPPPLICIEEPELGMHPDALRLIAELLVEASQRVQLVVTTHSEALIDALSENPESVLVCDRDFDGGTQCRRLSTKELNEWLKHYTLGELWRKGEIGGGRW